MGVNTEKASYSLETNSGASIDAFRDIFHINWVDKKDLGKLLTAQSYRAEIVESSHKIKSLGPWATLKEICNGNIIPGRGPEYSSSGVPCLKTKNVKRILIDPTVDEFVSKEYAMSHYKLRVPCEGILMNLSGAGSLGRTGIYLKNDFPMTNQHLVCFQVSPPFDAAYVAIFLSTWWGERLIEQGISGSTGQLWLNQDQLSDIPVPLFDESIQRAIGNKVRTANMLMTLAMSSNEETYQLLAVGSCKLPKEPITEACFVNQKNLSPQRLDAWFHRSFYIEMAERLKNTSSLIQVKDLCKVVTGRANLNRWPNQMFDYFEIGGIDTKTGEAVPTKTLVSEAPSRATTLVEAGDVLVSTVRPNLKAIGQISVNYTNKGVASSGFCVLRAKSANIGAYVRACLIQDVGTQQLMRWNAGGSYPSIEQSVPGDILIPFPGEEEISRIGAELLVGSSHIREANVLLQSAINDVLGLINGKLDVDLLISNNVQIEKWLGNNSSPHINERNS